MLQKLMHFNLKAMPWINVADWPRAHIGEFEFVLFFAKTIYQYVWIYKSYTIEV
jgi:hypothetical protein